MAEALLQAGLDLLEVTVEGHNAEMYERGRTPDSFATLVNNLSGLRRLRDRLRASTLIHIRLLMRPSHSAMEEQLQKFWLQFGDSMTKNRIIGYCCGDTDSYPVPRDRDCPACAFPFVAAEVRWNGDVPICSLSSFQTRTPNGVILGNVADASVMQIWHGPMANNFRQSLRQGAIADVELCRGCPSAIQPMSHRLGLNNILDPLFHRRTSLVV